MYYNSALMAKPSAGRLYAAILANPLPVSCRSPMTSSGLATPFHVPGMDTQ
jgi:hypothetical protein